MAKVVANKSLISGTNRVEVPFIKVQIGQYVFGLHVQTKNTSSIQGFYSKANIIYPNYIQSLNIQKINGQVNTYTLKIIYTIRPEDDPNFFEKVFSSVSATRKIKFTYGDMSSPQYVYKNEEAIITKIGTSFDAKAAKITYDVTAVSNGVLANSGGRFRPARRSTKPSTVIKEILKDKSNGLLDLFWGMSNYGLVEKYGLIESTDKEVDIDAQKNMSALDYIKYLVSIMIPSGTVSNTNKISSFYALTIHDEAESDSSTPGDISKLLGGPYFKIRQVGKQRNYSDAYDITIGYPSATIVSSFQLENNENYSLYYDFQEKTNSNEIVQRLDENGNWINEYAPIISSQNPDFKTRNQDKVWWSKVTQYPIAASIEIRGLLRPALLMEYVKLDIRFFGHKHVASGVYIITKQEDSISTSGYKTKLSLTKVDGESESELV